MLLDVLDGISFRKSYRRVFCESTIKSDTKIIGLSGNAFGAVENETNSSSENFEVSLLDRKITVKSTEKVSGKISIADADIVVSGGRGLKGPENRNIIEDLAETLGAATSCSKPVSDMGWTNWKTSCYQSIYCYWHFRCYSTSCRN